jgi:hypothetical protein
MNLRSEVYSVCRYWLSSLCFALVLCSSVYADDGPPELTPGVIGKKYAEQIAVTVSGQAPFTYALGGEEKPAGLTIDPQTGLLHGIPTLAAIGTHRVHVVVTDYAGKQTTQDFVLHVTASALNAAQHSAPVTAKPGSTSTHAQTTNVQTPPPQPNTVAVTINGSPVITSATDGLKTVSLTSPAFPAGVDSGTYQLSTIEAGKACAAGAGTAVAIAANTSADAKPSAATTLQLADALKEGSLLCAEESFKDAQGKEVTTAYSKQFPVTGAPSIAAAVSGAKTVAITSPALPSGASTGTYKLSTVDAGKGCTDVGTALSITDDHATPSTATTVTLADGLTEKSNLCVAEAFNDSLGKSVATAYSVPVTVDPAAGSPSIASAAAGVSTVSVTSPAFPKGVTSATYGLYNVDAGQPCKKDGSKQLTTVAGTSMDAKASDATTLTLTDPLKEGMILCAVETYKDSKSNTIATSDSNLAPVKSLEANWGRVRAYFVGGVLITNDSSSFSSAHQFYALNVEKSWHLPRCYLQGPLGEPGCIAEGSSSTLDLAGGSMHFTHPIHITGGSGKLGPPFAIDNATVEVTGEESITVTGVSIPLHKRQRFTVTSGTLKPQPPLTASTPPTPSTSPTPSNSPTPPTTADPVSEFTVDSGTLEISNGLLATAVELAPPKNWLTRQISRPGFSSYFETRLTAIPVVSNATNTSCTTAGNTTGTGTGTSTARASTTAATCSTGSSASSSTTSSFLTSQQTANVGVGVYLPYLVSRWTYKNTPNALFVAPIGKVGFNTITGATAQTVVLPGNGGTGTQTFDQIYNFYDYGARVGHMGLTNTTQVAPEIYSYLDFSLGRFSNLESLICHSPDQRGTAIAGNGCSTYGSEYTLDSRKRLYRIDIEGLLKIPDTLFYVGLNANIGQKQVMAEKLDPNFAAPNDLRFLFGTKFDIAQLFAKLGVKPQ